MLASVTSLDEALLALDAGVDMLDLKNPAEGALGALSKALVTELVTAIHGRRVVSATIGDLPMQTNLIVEATQAMLATGVDIVKIGFFAQGQHTECLSALKPLAANNKLIAVMFADQQPNLELLPAIAQAGFYGVMLDTAHKNGQHLLNHMNHAQLTAFVNNASALGLQVGLAGSLQAAHVQALCLIQPSYLGFRGALCEQSQRTLALDAAKILTIKNMLH